MASEQLGLFNRAGCLLDEAPVSPRTMMLGFVTAIYLRERHFSDSAATDQPQQAVVTLTLLVLSVALSLLAGYLLQKKNKATLKDDKPTTLVTRGSFMNWILGVRRVGPLFSWAGARFTTDEKTGKKGLFGDSPKQKIFHESGMHLLCVGPIFCLHQILSNGKAIFKGPISRLGHPSGTFVDLGSEGGFYIYWGEPTQPINTRLGAADRVGVASRWPYHCYVEWAPKRLGPAANWPLLDYEVERRIETPILTHPDPHILPTRSLTGPTRAVDSLVTTGATDHIVIASVVTHLFPAKTLVRTLSIPGLADQDLLVAFSTPIQVQIGIHPAFNLPIFTTHTEVHFIDGSLTGASAGGSIQSYVSLLNFGINPAHGMASIFFDKWPLGLGLPQTGDEAAFDLSDGVFSLNTLASLFEEGAEELRASFISLDGDTYQTVIGAALQDLGVMIPLNADSGLIEFRPVREPTGTVRRLRNEMLVDAFPEVEVVHIDNGADRLTFSFPDRNLTDRDATIAIMNDGQISRLETQHARNVQITITTDFVTASSIAQRRSQEELGQGTAVRIRANRAARTLVPGEALTVDAMAEIQRVESVKLNPETNEVTLTLLADFYGVAKSPFVDTSPPETSQFPPVAPDLIKAIFEVPEIVLIADAQTVLVPRVRATSSIAQAQIHISRDNVTYTAQGVEFGVQTGGLIDAILPAPGADGLMFLEQGPEFTVLGPDIGSVEDLSLDVTNWTAGRQWMVISSLAGIELCFVRNITFIAGTTWRADGVIRARYHTQALEHEAGAEIYIFQTDDIFPVQDVLLDREVALYAKTQPQGGGILPLDADTPVSTLLYGRAQNQRPSECHGLAVVNAPLVNAYLTGDDVALHWQWPNAQQVSASAGLQPAGNAVVDPPFDGDFILEVRDAAGTTIERTEPRTTNTFNYTNANIVSDHAGQPTFQVWVYSRRGGLLSDPIKLTVEKL